MQFKQHNPTKKQIAQLIQAAALKAFDQDISQNDLYKLISITPKIENGDYAFGCFTLSKALKKSPAEISKSLVEHLDSNMIKEVQAMGPYLNFFIHPNELAKSINLEGNIVEESEKTIIEFSQPNTHKEMHVGHMRNLCLGDAIIKLHRYSGIETLSTTFPGDVGTHVAKCLWYYNNHADLSKIPSERKGAWLGKLYTSANNLLEEQKGTDLEEQNRKELTEILKQIESGKGKYFDQWKETREWSIELMQDVYKWANVEFDSWYWESTVDSSSVNLVNEYLDKGLFIKDQGAVGIDLSDDKLGFCLLLKSDGTGLYATKDLELARRKFQDQKVDKSVYVVDNRQALHFKQVFKTLEKMGFDKASDCYHLQYEMVELTDGAMSSRKGNVVALQSLIDQMQETIINDYLAKYESLWPKEEIESSAHKIAASAIKFGMNKIDPNKKIVFDMKEWLRLDGESGPYIQYVYARIQSMLNKVENIKDNVDLNVMESTYERSVLIQLANFNDIVENSLKNYKTNLLCNYLYDLSKSYNQFYANCSILKAESEELKMARASLSKLVANNLKKGLELLGIECPERM